MSTKVEAVNVGSNKKVRVSWIFILILLALLLCTIAGSTYMGNAGAGTVLSYTVSEPIGDVTEAKAEINPGDGNLTVDGQTDEQVLVSGVLQYLEKNGLPITAVNPIGGQITLTLNANGGQQWNALPWSACNGATDWLVHLNSRVITDITTYSDGGNILLNLAGMVVSRVSAETGGGNVTVIMPAQTANLNMVAKTGAGDVNVEIGGTTGSGIVNASSGAGNVTVRVPDGIAARIHATSGMGKVMIDSRFTQIDDTTYQSPDYDRAADRVEITINSGAGNVSVNTK